MHIKCKVYLCYIQYKHTQRRDQQAAIGSLKIENEEGGDNALEDKGNFKLVA